MLQNDTPICPHLGHDVDVAVISEPLIANGEDVLIAHESIGGIHQSSPWPFASVGDDEKHVARAKCIEIYVHIYHVGQYLSLHLIALPMTSMASVL